MKKLTFEMLDSLRQGIQMAWDADTAYEDAKAKRHSPVGQCYTSTLVLYLALEEFRPVVIQGYVDGFEHYWLQVGRKIVDLTGDQFEGLPPVVWGRYDEYPAYEYGEVNQEFARFLTLLRRSGLGMAQGTLDSGE